jgi:hypothetical protein
LEAVVRFRTGQGEVEGTVRQFWHPGPLEFGVVAERVTRTNEEWIAGAVSNSVSYLVTGDDFRDYYQADRAALVVRGRGGRGWTPEVRVGWEDAKTRRAGVHWTMFGSRDDVRPNPAVAEGETWSASLGLGVDRATGVRGRLVGRAYVEVADSAVAGDFSYVLGELRARWTTSGIGLHELDLFALARGDVSGNLPIQRWTGFGGRATMPTFDILSLRGSRVVYGHLGYSIPISGLEAGPLGSPAVFGRVAAGAAWTSGDSADVRANLLLGLQFWLLEGGLAVDPDADGEASGYAVVRFPGDL